MKEITLLHALMVAAAIAAAAASGIILAIWHETARKRSAHDRIMRRIRGEW